MKYIPILILISFTFISCSSVQKHYDCEEIERENILNVSFSVLKCEKPINEKIGECSEKVGKDGKYMCFVRGNWWRKEI